MLPVAILAGGLGTRLRPVTETIPKILVEIAGRSFAEHQLDWLQSEGVTHVVYCLGYLGEQVVEALGDGSHRGMHFDFVMDGPTLLGTGGALRRALPQLGERFFVLYGDSLLTCNIADVAHAYVASGRACLMTVFPNENRWDRSNIVFRDGKIVAYDKRRQLPGMGHIDYGLGILAARVLLGYPADRPFDLAGVYQDQLAAGELAGYEVITRFYEVGSPAGLEETRAYLARKATNG
jgi:MurNAc alpha-1-phosphate uridylyltransferase